jgi:tetratricopeptide (TPR) repeat protein
MKPGTSLKKELAKIRRLCDARRFDRAFVEMDRVLKHWPDNPHALVLWANLLQLQEEDVGPPLEEAKKALHKATDLDEHGPMPLIELGHYLYALDDDSKEACKYFDKAIALCKRLLQEAYLGKAKALGDLERTDEAFACLAKAYLEAQNGNKAANGREILAEMGELSQSK